MLAVRKLNATVGEGGKVEVTAPDLPVGQRVEVILLLEEQGDGKRPALDILDAAPGHRLFKTAEEVDAYLRNERDSRDC